MSRVCKFLCLVSSAYQICLYGKQSYIHGNTVVSTFLFMIEESKRSYFAGYKFWIHFFSKSFTVHPTFWFTLLNIFHLVKLKMERCRSMMTNSILLLINMFHVWGPVRLEFIHWMNSFDRQIQSLFIRVGNLLRVVFKPSQLSSINIKELEKVLWLDNY